MEKRRKMEKKKMKRIAMKMRLEVLMIMKKMKEM